MERGIEEGILEDILIRQKAEVCAMVLTEYNEKKHMRTLYREGYDSGYDSGKMEEKKKMIRYFLSKEMPCEQIGEIVECDLKLICQVRDEMKNE